MSLRTFSYDTEFMESLFAVPLQVSQVLFAGDEGDAGVVVEDPALLCEEN